MTLITRPDHILNDVHYPSDVEDLHTLKYWISLIARPMTVSTIWSSNDETPHRELLRRAMFKADDPKSQAMATKSAAQSMALAIFEHMVMAPKGKIIWRIDLESDIHDALIPSDLAKIETREMAEARVGLKNISAPVALKSMLRDSGPLWGIDFNRDCIVPMACPFGEWKVIKFYTRYSIIVDGKAVPWIGYDERFHLREETINL